ncbi:serine hydrolase-domain-containing protein [Xylaria scruposa]|nr:serine hydrolase-domain-containing protein [Xylaria scruposa]
MHDVAKALTVELHLLFSRSPGLQQSYLVPLSDEFPAPRFTIHPTRRKDKTSQDRSSSLRTMRILCLHGTAINATIFQSKTEKMRSFLPQDYLYEWFEGDIHVVPQKFLSEVYPGPYLTYVDILTADSVARALRRIEEFIESDGPFDGVMGVSEGSMLAAALLLKHQIENPFSAPLFRFAIFISGTLPFSWSSSVGQDVSGLITGDDPLSTDASLWQRQADCGPVYAPLPDSEAYMLADMFPTWKSRVQSLEDLIRAPENTHLRPYCFHPDLHEERINIPTAHVWGLQDLFKPHAEHLVRLCDTTVAAVYEHSGAHDVPHSIEDNKRFSEVIRKTILRSEFAI